jgi:prepilin-type N-terminal cleavage/methylation domain-containing protein
MIHRNIRHRRRGFTMIEILVVVGVILLLMTMSIGLLRNAVGTARQRQTEATILKVHGLMQQRMDAFYRAMERTNLKQATDKIKMDWYTTYNMIPPDRAIDVMVKKSIFQSRFPQMFLERNLLTNPPSGVTVVPANHQTVTQSAALLYWTLTDSEVFGVAPVDESEFTSSEVRDTDGDGLLEFVDGWGKPLRFYRWTSHLFRPGDGASVPPGIDSSGNLSPPNRLYVSVIWSGLPAIPTVAGELDPLARDPDDPTGQLYRFVTSPGTPPGAITAVQNFYGTPGTYNAFLIMSAGPDGVLGLLEPSNEPTVDITTPAAGVPQGRLAALASWAPIESNPINDNITNRKR